MNLQHTIFTLAFALISSTCHGMTGQAVNSILGDQSFVSKFGKQPDASSNEDLCIRTHLEYVENLLRKKDVSGLAIAQKEKRIHLLNLLHDYASAGIFPGNYDYPGKRMPCFIDKEGSICAVGYLIEQTAGRQVAEQINEEYQYARLMDMNSPLVDNWISESGLTKTECAMIQPEYPQRNIPQIIWAIDNSKKEKELQSKLDSQAVKTKKLNLKLDSLNLALDSMVQHSMKSKDSATLAIKKRDEHLSTLQKNHEKRLGQLYILIISLGVLTLGSFLSAMYFRGKVGKQF